MSNGAAKLGLGTVQFGTHYGISNSKGQTTIHEVKEIVEYASHIGVSVLDTASSYGNAEHVLGQCDLTTFKIVSKFLTPPAGESIEVQVEKSIRHLNVKHLYGYLAHRPIDVVKQPLQWTELKNLKEKGLIQKIGFSFNSPDELEKVLSMKMYPDLIQVPFNYLDNRFKKYFRDLKERGCEIHTRSTFLQGLFFVETNRLNPFFDPVKSVLTELQHAYGADLPHLLLKYVYECSEIDTVVIGTETIDQLQSNLEFLNQRGSLPQLASRFPDHILMPMYWPKTA